MKTERSGFLIVFCSVLVSGHWFDHGGHFESEFDKLFWLTRGLQVTRSHGALLQWKRSWPWIFEPTNSPPERLSCAGSAWPGLVKNVSSLFIYFSYPLYLTLRHIEGVCHLSSRSGLQLLDIQHFGLRVNLRHVVRGQVAVLDCRWSSNLGLGASVWQVDKTFVFAKINSMGFTKLWTLEYFSTVSFCTKPLF